MSWALGGLIFLGCLVASTMLGDLLSEEIRGWLDLAPQGLLCLAAMQLDPVQRATIYQDEWLPELAYILMTAWADQLVGSEGGTTSCLTCRCVPCT